jgi:hypothetical protein
MKRTSFKTIWYELFFIKIKLENFLANKISKILIVIYSKTQRKNN